MTDLAIRTYASRDALAAKVAGLLAGRLRAAIEQSGVARMAVPGGTTPGPMLCALGRCDLDWSKVAVTLTDERWVPVTSDRSNEGLVRRTLLCGTAAAAAFVPLYSGDPDPAQGIATVRDGLARQAVPLDVAVLGIGADMHTASLFPRAAGLERALAANAPTAVAIDAAGGKEPRITLSVPVLARAERHVLIAGADKRAALDRAREIGDPIHAPVCAVLGGATVHYAD